MLTTIYHVYAHAFPHTNANEQTPTPCGDNPQAGLPSALIASLAQAKSVSSLHANAQAYGFDVSLRTARRVFDGTLTPQSDILQRALALIDAPSATSSATAGSTPNASPAETPIISAPSTATHAHEHAASSSNATRIACRPHPLGRVVSFDKADLHDFQAQVASSFAQLAQRYYVFEQPPIHVQCAKNELRISIPLCDASETAQSCTLNTQTSLL